MDSDWKCLVDEMWESYLCEENIGASSFYEATSSDPFSNMHDVQFDQSYLFEEARLVYENDAEQQQQSCPEDQHCEPLEHLFELLQKGTLLNSHEELENCEQKTVDPRFSSENKMTSYQEEKNKKDAETNTRKMKKIAKARYGEKRKRNSYKKRSHPHVLKLKKK